MRISDWSSDVCSSDLTAAESFGAAAQRAVARRVAPGGKVDADLLEREQFAAHGFAWLATYVAALRELLHWAERLQAAGQLGELERLMLQATYGEYLSQLTGGIALSQVEVLRPGALGMSDAEDAELAPSAGRKLTDNGHDMRTAIAGPRADGHTDEDDP